MYVCMRKVISNMYTSRSCERDLAMHFREVQCCTVKYSDVHTDSTAEQ